MKKTLTLLCLAVLMTVTAMASGPFREHRWESFHGLKPTENNIVFVGNSITNMHDWWEAFGCNHQILNRGTSGGFATEILTHLESILVGHPAKVFIGIGTNDITNTDPAIVADNIRVVITRIRRESPNTEVYLQSVLPSTSGNRGQRVVTLNNLLKPIAADLNTKYGKVTYLDVFSQLVATDGISFKTFNGKSLAFDNLHPTVVGYGLWCNYIAPQVGSECVYDTKPSTLYSGGHGSDSTGDRITCFAQQVVNANDILFLGDEMVSSGEWHEWLQSDKVKNRGLGWGYTGSDLNQLITNASIYFQHKNSVAPKAILVYAGVQEAISGTAATTFKTRCQNLINGLRNKAPQTMIYFITPLNTPNSSYNNTLKNYITQLNSLTSSNTNVKVIDATSMNGTSKYFYQGDGGNYFTSYGYAKLSQIIEAAVKADFPDADLKAVTDAECTANNNLYAARAVLGNALTDAFRNPGKTGTGIGEYSEGSLEQLNAKIDEACALLNNPSATAEQFRAAAEELKNFTPTLNLPEAGKSYTICCYYPSGEAGRYLIVKNGGLQSTTTLPADNSAHWKYTGKGLQSVAEPTKYLSVNQGFKLVTTEPTIQFSEGLNAGKLCVGEVFDGGVRNGALNSNGTVDGGQFTNGRYDNYQGWSSDFTIQEATTPDEAKLLEEAKQAYKDATDAAAALADKYADNDNADVQAALKTLDEALKANTVAETGTAKQFNAAAEAIDAAVKAARAAISNALGEEKAYTIDKKNGRFTATNPGGSWASVWTSNDDLLKFTASANNMAWKGDNIDARCGTAGSSTYAIEPADKDNYVITGYSLKLHANGASNESWNINGKTYTSTSASDIKEINVTGIEERRVQFSETGTNGVGTLLYDFTVTMRYQPRDPSDIDYLEKMTVFDNAASSIPYRIPAVGQAKNGDLIFVADYRYSGGDIGVVPNGKLDLRFRKKYADGTWGEVKTLAACITSPTFTAFGDPCIVCDRETGRVMVTSCCGNVSFPSGTYDNHQGWSRWYSEDGGETWESSYTDLAPQVVAWLDKRQGDKLQAFFIGSGKISQSSTIKVGKYYRLYCASNTRMQSGKCNFVWYSDDFGETWNMLGTPDVKPINGGDEPKAEEMPDGSVVVSSRDSGRIFNVFHYTNIATGEGYWGKQTTSSSNNNGCYGASCNGEIMFMPVTRTEDGAKTYLALQSVPMSGSRVNVGIYWKDLADLSYYRTAAELAPNWTAYQISETTSAYSTMCQMQDGAIAFFYEENEKGGGYDMVYKKFDINKITKGRYSYSALTDAEKADYLSDGVDPYFDGKTLTDKLSKAIEAYKANPTAANYEILNEAVLNPEGGDDPTPTEGGKYYIRLDGTDLYFSTTEVPDNDITTYSISAEKETFLVTPSADGFTIQSLDTEKYVGHSQVNSWDFTDYASVWYIETLEGEPTAILKDGSKGFGVDEEFDGAGVFTDKTGQLWVFEPAEVVGINVLRPELQNAIRFDLQGRRINAGARGIVLQRGAKVIK